MPSPIPGSPIRDLPIPSSPFSGGPIPGSPIPGSPIPDSLSHRKRPLVRRAVGLAAVVGFCAFWLFATLYPLHYVEIRPGPAIDIGPRLVVSGGLDQPAKGRVLFATVLLRRRVTLLEATNGWLRSSIDVFRERDIFGSETPGESIERERAEIDDAKIVASVVAQRRLGFAIRGEGARVVSIEPNVPAAAVLREGDVIESVDGVSICLRGDARLGLRGRRGGDAVALSIRRGGTGSEIAMSVRLVEDGATGTPLLGLELETVRCRPPYAVSVDTDGVLGASAGLGLTLAMIDRLSPGELTGRATVATTGTIEADGSIGEVGGVKQKTLAMRAAGAKLFLVPVAEFAEARRYAGRMRVVPVRSIDDALAAMHAAGGTPLPQGTTP